MDDVTMARELLKELVTKAGGQSAFARKAGVSKQWVNKLLNPSNPFALNARSALEEKLGMPAGYFSGKVAATPSPVPFVLVPLLSWAEAGVVGQEEVRRDRPIVNAPMQVSDRAFALTVESDSMVSPSPAERSLPPGMLIIVDPSVPPKAGDFVVARLPGAPAATCRKLIEDSGFLYLAALNPRYTELVRVTPDVQLVGRVMGALATF